MTPDLPSRGHENREGVRFCAECGTALARRANRAQRGDASEAIDGVIGWGDRLMSVITPEEKYLCHCQLPLRRDRS